MERVAIISDIHGNIIGTRAVLSYLDGIGGVDKLIAAGDILGGGTGGDDLLELLQENDCAMLRGNFEDFLIDPDQHIGRVSKEWQGFLVRLCQWVEKQLSPASIDLVANMPLSKMLTFGGDFDVFVCHATPEDTWARVCAADAQEEKLRRAYGDIDADVIVYGHYHQHHVMRLDSKLLINVASVGLRSDAYCACTLIENIAGRCVVRQQMVGYDRDAEARLMVERGVPQP
jgi:predicted phosphodiesterase